MSFNFEFNAGTIDRAREIIAKEHAPDVVKAFLGLALDGIERNQEPQAVLGIYVKAVGHLHNGQDYAVSTANIEVRRIMAR